MYAGQCRWNGEHRQRRVLHHAVDEPRFDHAHDRDRWRHLREVELVDAGADAKEHFEIRERGGEIGGQRPRREVAHCGGIADVGPDAKWQIRRMFGEVPRPYRAALGRGLVEERHPSDWLTMAKVPQAGIGLRRLAFDHGNHAPGVLEADAVEPGREPARCIDVDAQESSRVHRDPVSDQRLGPIHIRRYHWGSDGVAASEPAKERESDDLIARAPARCPCRFSSRGLMTFADDMPRRGVASAVISATVAVAHGTAGARRGEVPRREPVAPRLDAARSPPTATKPSFSYNRAPACVPLSITEQREIAQRPPHELACRCRGPAAPATRFTMPRTHAAHTCFHVRMVPTMPVPSVGDIAGAQSLHEPPVLEAMRPAHVQRQAMGRRHVRAGELAVFHWHAPWSQKTRGKLC
jgi:hypothetical protein